MKSIRFERAAVDADGEPLFNLWIDGRLVERGLDIQQVVQRISRSEFPDAPEEAQHDENRDLP